MRRNVSRLCTLAVLLAAPVAHGDDGSRLMSLDHYVRVKSTALRLIRFRGEFSYAA
jgi:hypothetical protein